MFDPNQLVCSGAVQYYANTAGARNLLRSWLAAIHRYPDVADDESLDATFNFPTTAPVTTAWLEKEYCRYPWWIHIRPVIDHPDGPAAVDHSRSFVKRVGQDRIDAARLRSRPSKGPFPRDCVIDVEAKILYRLVGKKLVPMGPFDTKLWLGNY
jgi:hypothetical protein